MAQIMTLSKINYPMNDNSQYWAMHNEDVIVRIRALEAEQSRILSLKENALVDSSLSRQYHSLSEEAADLRKVLTQRGFTPHEIMRLVEDASIQ